MPFLEKLAKLRTDIQQSGPAYEILVYDDEISESAIMTMDFDFYSSSGQTALHVNMIDFDDTLFFKMPQERQDRCGTVLLKRFIKEYKRLTNGTIPVAANFMNYDLQEKFKQAVEMGIFPKESLEISEFTTKENYDSNPRFNMDNRKMLNDIKNDIAGYFKGATLNSHGFFTNYPTSSFFSSLNELNIPLEAVEFIVGYINEGNVYYTASFLSDDPFKTQGSSPISFNYFLSTKSLNFNYEYETVMARLGNSSRDNLKFVFDDIQTVELYYYSVSPQEFFESIELENETVARNFSRLKKIAQHDMYNRDLAISYINGDVYEGKSHAETINIFLDDNEFERNDRPYNEELPIEVDQIAFAHLVESEKAIYIEKKTMMGVVLDEVVQVIKNKYPDYEIFNDDNKINGEYVKLAKLRKR